MIESKTLEKSRLEYLALKKNFSTLEVVNYKEHYEHLDKRLQKKIDWLQMLKFVNRHQEYCVRYSLTCVEAERLCICGRVKHVEINYDIQRLYLSLQSKFIQVHCLNAEANLNQKKISVETKNSLFEDYVMFLEVLKSIEKKTWNSMVIEHIKKECEEIQKLVDAF